MVVLRFVIALLLSFVCRSASAEEGSPDRSSSGPNEALSVRVVSAGDAETTAALQQHILTLLSERQVHLEWQREAAIRGKDVLNQSSSEENNLANIWLDVTEDRRALLYIKNARSDRFLVRTLPLENGYDELGRESLANIVESAIDVLLQGGEIGVTREEAEKQVAAQAPEPSPPLPPKEEKSSPPPEPVRAQRISPALFVAAAGDVIAPQAVRAGPRLGGSLYGARIAGFTWFSSLEGGYAFATPIESDEVRLRLEGPNGRWVAGFRLASGRFGWRLGLGGGLDAMKVTTEVKDPSLRKAASLWVMTPLVSGMTSLDLALSDRWFGFFSAAADVVLTAHDFEVVRSGDSESLLSPWRVRPLTQIGVGFFLGK